jgi:hypothetical protein
MRGWIVLLCASLLSAQVAPTPKYKVVKADKPEPAIAALNTLADQGYRLLVPGPMLITRLESTPPDTYRYLEISSKVGPVQFLNWVNEQGAHGYRWVPDAGLMEKEPHPRNYEYASARIPEVGPRKPPAFSSLISQGYRPLQFVWFSAWVGAGQTELFFERELVEKPKPEVPGSAGWDFAIADALRASNVQKQIDALAKNDYRYLGRYVSRKGGGQAALMQKCGQGEGPFEYRYFDVHSKDQLETELNKQGKEGFRVVSKALTRPPHLLERAKLTQKIYAYRVVEGKDPAALEQVLNAPEQEGYLPVGYVWRVGWTVEGFLLLEKVATASVTP